MNPQEFGWEEHQQVVVENPFNEPFQFKVHGKGYQVPAMSRTQLPGFMAWLFVYNVAHELCDRDGGSMRWNDDGFRQQYYEKVAVEIKPLVQAIVDPAEAEASDYESLPSTGIPAAKTQQVAAGQDTADDKPLEDQNMTELRKTAEREHVSLTDKQDTKNKMRLAIHTARASKM